MSKDLCIDHDGGVVNIRVGAIIMKDGKFLMAANPNFDYLYSVGGRIRFGETAEEAVVREVFEETGRTIGTFEELNLTEKRHRVALDVDAKRFNAEYVRMVTAMIEGCD